MSTLDIETEACMATSTPMPVPLHPCGHPLHPWRIVGCTERQCQLYAFQRERTALGRGASRLGVPRPLSVRRRTRRTLRPGQAVVRYHDGSQYTLTAILAVRRPVAGGLQIVQALPKRATAQGTIEHFIPATNVDVVSWRRRDWPAWAMTESHAHCGHCGGHHDDAQCPTRAEQVPPPAPWYVRVWDWLWGPMR